MSTFIIAEAGVNHNGSLDVAIKMIDAAKKAGVDCIKFQTFRAKDLVSSMAVKAEYQKKQTKNDENQLLMLQKMELSHADFSVLAEHCKKRDIIFLSTPFDLYSIEFLQTLHMQYWKIPSGEITNLPYLIKIAQTHMPVILSTGMSTLAEISDALQALREHGCGEVILLHLSLIHI